MIRFLCFDRLVVFLVLSWSSCTVLNASLQLIKASEKIIEGSSPVARLNPPHSLYTFFGLGNLQGLSSDIRRKLIPMSFCGSLERTPLREWQMESLHDTVAGGELFKSEIALSEDGSHIAVILNHTCLLINLASGVIVAKYECGDNRSMSSVAFSADGSKAAFIDNANDRIIERSLHNYEFQDALSREVRVKEDYRISNFILSKYDRHGRLIIIKRCRSVIICNPGDQSPKQFYEACACSADCGYSKDCERATEMCLNDTMAAFISPHGLQFFSFDTDSWKSHTLDLVVDPCRIKIKCIAFNEDGTLFLVGYRQDFSEDNIRIFDRSSCKLIQEISLGESGDGPQGYFRDAHFMCNSQCILVLRNYASQLYHIQTGAILAEYPHESRAWRHEDRGYRLEKGKWIRAQELRAPNFDIKGERGFVPSQQRVNPQGTQFTTLSEAHVKLYGLPQFLPLFFDKDTDKGALERILFLQYLRIISRLGLRLTVRGLEVNPVVEKWQKVAPSSMCNELNNPSKPEYKHVHVIMDELQAVFQSFSPTLQKLLKAQYHLPWETL